MRGIVLILVAILVLYRCSGTDAGKAQKVINETIKAHGGYYFENSKVSFSFRDREYSVTRNGDKYIYTRSFIDHGDTIEDVLVNSKEFTRYKDGEVAHVPDTMKIKYSNSINSVLYFMQLPYLLNDPAVRKKYIGEIQVKNEKYHVIKITFKAEDGGKDFEDEYMYWINKSTNKVDYLAYNYQTDGGGVRFRSAYNRLERGGILFQDYVNYEAPINTKLHLLPKLFEDDKLKELSRIENFNISVHKLMR